MTLCSVHYKRQIDGRDMDAPMRGERRCTVDGCDRKHDSGGYCQMHADRVRKSGDPGPAEPLRAPNGAGWTNAQGYRATRKGGRGRKAVLEHRAVMEQMIGRLLDPHESVHHKNGVRHDNRPDNLELWVKSHGAGQRVEDLVAFVVDHYPGACRAALDGEPQETWLAPRASTT
jgi:hypothetical protein